MKFEDKNIKLNNNMTVKKKCLMCNKKLSLLDRGKFCKCGNNFCPEHFLPEYHNCSYDFKEEKLGQLSKNLEVIENNKIECRIK